MVYTKTLALLCHPYHRGGVTRWMIDMAEECAKNDIDVYFITVEPRKEFVSSGGKETIVSLLPVNKNLHVIKKRVGWEFEFGTKDYKAAVYAKLLSDNVPPGTMVILADDAAIWETSVLCADNYLFVGVLHSDEKTYYELAEKYNHSIGLFVCVSRRIAKTLTGKIGSGHIVTIPCGIPLPPFAEVDRKEDILKLVFLGRLSEYPKYVSGLVEICSELVKKKVSFSLKIIGDGEERMKLEKKFANMGLDDKVSFLGWLSRQDIFRHLENSDFVLLTSQLEGMPIAMMEGLSAGCGVISTRVSGVEDFENSQLAKYCLWVNDIGDMKQAADNIIQAMLVPVAQRRQAARTFAAQEFSIESCREKYIDVINRLIFQNNFKPGRIHFRILARFYSFLLAVSRWIRVNRQI